MLKFERFSHVSIIVSNLKKAETFYGKVIGLKKIARPKFPFPGAWYSLQNKIELHIIVNKTRTHRWKRPTSTNVRYPHFALWVGDADRMAKHLQKNKIAFHEYVSTPTKSRQIFLYDPDGNMVELIGSTRIN